MIGDQGRMTTGMPERYDTRGGAPDAQQHADQAAGGRHDGRLDQELLDDVAAARAKARRMPISRVRSETVASMMFMMPIPPTRSEMLAIEPSTRLKIR